MTQGFGFQVLTVKLSYNRRSKGLRFLSPKRQTGFEDQGVDITGLASGCWVSMVVWPEF